jgi:uncharacterized protein YbaR (Trm112 family)
MRCLEGIPMSAISISLNLLRLQDVSDVRCPKCQSPLDLHQPDSELPERLIGTCEDCIAWYLMDIAKGVMVLLPVEELLHGA